MKDETRYMTEQETMAYLSASRTLVRTWGQEIGARRKIKESVRYDKEVIDAELLKQGEVKDDAREND